MYAAKSARRVGTRAYTSVRKSVYIIRIIIGYARGFFNVDLRPIFVKHSLDVTIASNTIILTLSTDRGRRAGHRGFVYESKTLRNNNNIIMCCTRAFLRHRDRWHILLNSTFAVIDYEHTVHQWRGDIDFLGKPPQVNFRGVVGLVD